MPGAMIECNTCCYIDYAQRLVYIPTTVIKQESKSCWLLT